MFRSSLMTLGSTMRLKVAGDHIPPFQLVIRIFLVIYFLSIDENGSCVTTHRGIC